MVIPPMQQQQQQQQKQRFLHLKTAVVQQRPRSQVRDPVCREQMGSAIVAQFAVVSLQEVKLIVGGRDMMGLWANTRFSGVTCSGIKDRRLHELEKTFRSDIAT